MKKYIRYLYRPNHGDREALKQKLNALGFYVLNGPEGLDVYAIEYPETIEDWLVAIFKSRS